MNKISRDDNSNERTRNVKRHLEGIGRVRVSQTLQQINNEENGKKNHSKGLRFQQVIGVEGDIAHLEDQLHALETEYVSGKEQLCQLEQQTLEKEAFIQRALCRDADQEFRQRKRMLERNSRLFQQLEEQVQALEVVLAARSQELGDSKHRLQQLESAKVFLYMQCKQLL